MHEMFEVITRPGLEYAVHDGVKLVGDLYAPRGSQASPVIVAAHGGGWQLGDRSSYKYWGPYFAQHGIALFAIEYRLSAAGKPTFPKAVHDLRAAVQFVRGRAADLGIDPQRIAVMGDSAGGHLTSLVALAGDAPTFAGAYTDDPHARASTAVKAVVAFYGVYDLGQQWQHDIYARPRDSIVEKFLGKSLLEDRRIYFEASPLSYATTRPNAPAFLLIWGTQDDIVDYRAQSEEFRDALKQAQFYVRTVVVDGAPHFFAVDPLDEPGSQSGFAAPRILRFLQERL
jgi:acetyl esterase/lipase